MRVSTSVKKIKYGMQEWKQELKTEIEPTHITTTRYHLNAWAPQKVVFHKSFC